MSIDQLSFHHLKVFLAVFRHKSANLAATELGLSNSAISRALKFLRETFNDELFVRTGSGYIPTGRANDLAETVERIVGDMRLLGREYSVFDVSKSEGTFEIRVYDEFSYAVQTVIDTVIKPQAPKMHFNVRILTYDCIPELVNGTVDFAVVYEGFDDPRLSYECFAHTGDIFLLLRKGHPLLGLDEITVDDVSRYPLLEIDNYRDLACPLLVDLCHEKGSDMKVAAYTESVASAFRILSRTDSVTVMCNHFTRSFARMVPDITYVKLPAPMLNRIKEMRSEIRPIGNYVAFGNTNNSPAFRWVKNELVNGLRTAWFKAINDEF